ncbi:MAG: MBL fold metallo-hydrolase [Chloroflexales bacterium]|nr:MBL fold metallo-hydrolase [Chloroflexales bacterium]
MARMILLGVGTGVPDVDRENTHMVWDGPGGPLLIDAGGSTYQRLLRAGLNPQQLRGIFLTHSHADHINGVPILFFSIRLAGRQEPITIYGLEATLTLVQNVVEAFNLEKYTTPINWIPVAAGDTLPLEGGWTLRTALTEHSRPCLATRFENRASGQALTYSADTAPCQAVTDLARGANALIHEATTSEPFVGHTTPRQAGEVASIAGVGRLTLVHFSPHWTMPVDQALAEIRAGGFSGPADVGQEYQVIEL